MDEEYTALEEARKKYVLVRVHCPNLDKNLNPDFKLINMTCPFKQDGHCGQCEHLAGVYSEEGTFFSYGSYEGFCDYHKE